jgi:nucleoside-diphosphate-sugar epimerase
MSDINNHSATNLGKCLVTGGAGMLGYQIVQQLLERGIKVRVLDIQSMENNGIEFIKGDIRDPEIVQKAVKGIDTVFHSAALVWDPTKDEELYHDINVLGNRNLLQSSQKEGVRKYIFTSTMDVIVSDSKPIINADESIPYPNSLSEDPYSRSKILAEKETIGANKPDFLTCSLRPVGIYGPRDKYHLPNLIEVAKSNFNVKLGNGSARFSHVYAGNVAHAHILAAEHLEPDSCVSGECYFITDHEPPENFFTFLEPILERLGYPLPERKIPYRLARVLAWISEKINPRSTFNTFSVINTCKDRTFCGDKARKHFGYEPLYSKEEAFEQTVEWFITNGQNNENQGDKSISPSHHN